MSIRSTSWTVASPAGPAPGHLYKTPAPDGHLSTLMGHDDRSAIDNGSDLSDEEKSATP